MDGGESAEKREVKGGKERTSDAKEHAETTTNKELRSEGREEETEEKVEKRKREQRRGDKALEEAANEDENSGADDLSISVSEQSFGR